MTDRPLLAFLASQVIFLPIIIWSMFEPDRQPEVVFTGFIDGDGI